MHRKQAAVKRGTAKKAEKVPVRCAPDLNKGEKRGILNKKPGMAPGGWGNGT